MTDRKLHIRQLMLERLTGIIPAEDDRYLQQLIDAEEEVRALWMEFQEEARESEVRYFIERLDTKEELAVLTKRVPGQEYRLAEWVVAIGIIVILGSISYLFPFGSEQPKEKTPPRDSLTFQKR
jgi:hypothetical protein